MESSSFAMYHMLPFSLRHQEPNCSRAKHGEFQNLVEEFVHKVQPETDVVTAENPNARRLFNLLDSFFSYGLLTGDECYWRCIRIFLPRAEQKMLIAECGNANDRFLSIGWLKTSFNKGTLYFMLLSLNNQVNKKWLPKYYHANSCIRNAGLLEAITNYMELIQPVQFAFYVNRRLREEPIPAAVVETTTVQISSRQAARQRKLTEKEESQEVVPNIIPTEIPQIITQAVEQEVLLEEIMRVRNSRITNQLYDAQHQEQHNQNDGPSHVVVEEEKLEDVMTKKMSYAHMESMDPDGIDQLLARVQPVEPLISAYSLVDGEYQMCPRDVLHLAINIFKMPSEKTMECFKVLENFHSDDAKLRYLVITNYNVYVFKYRDGVHGETPDKLPDALSDGFFIPLLRMAHDRIRTIKISVDNLSFCIESNDDGFCYFVQEEERDDKTHNSYAAAMCGMESGAHMINSLINVVEHSSLPLPIKPITDDNASYMAKLQPNLEKELGRSFHSRGYFLCYWYEQSELEIIRSLATKAGYLFKTSVGNWMKSSDDAEQKYCMVIGGDFHMFTDSNCKIGGTVIKLSDTTFVNTGRSTFQLKGHDGAFEFECSTLEDHNEWSKILAMHTENKVPTPYNAPCLAVLTEKTIALVQEGEKFWADGFLRLLNEIPKYCLKELIVVHPPEDKENFFHTRSPALCLVTDEDTIHYIFIRFSKELDRVATAVQSAYDIQWKLFDEEYALTDFGRTINNVCCNAMNIWPL